jgi:hypothetical protein
VLGGAAPGTLSATPFAPNEQVGKSLPFQLCRARPLRNRKRSGREVLHTNLAGELSTPLVRSFCCDKQS